MKNYLRSLAGLAVVITLIASTGLLAQAALVNGDSLEGRWDASVKIKDVVAPFHLDITGTGVNLTGMLYNGEQKQTTTSIVPAPTASAIPAIAWQNAADKPYVVEYYYKVKWGYADEFIRLFKKNHYPVLKKEKELGRILQVSAAAPKNHATEDGRWDYRVTIVWKNVSVTNDGFDSQPLIRQLFPDQDTFKKEEQRRFEILAGHWDVPVANVDLEK